VIAWGGVYYEDKDRDGDRSLLLMLREGRDTVPQELQGPGGNYDGEHEGCVTGVAITPDGFTLLSVSSMTYSILAWDVNGSPPRITKRLHRHSTCCWNYVSIAVAADVHARQWALLGLMGLNVTLRLGEPNIMEVVRTTWHGNTVALSPDARLCASGSEGGIVKLWKTNTGDYVHALEWNGGCVLAISFSGDARRLAASFINAAVCVWSAEDATCLQVFEGWVSGVTRCLWSANDRCVILCTQDAPLRVWDTTTEREVDCSEEVESQSMFELCADPSLESYVAIQSDDALVEWTAIGCLGFEARRQFLMVARCAESVIQDATGSSDGAVVDQDASSDGAVVDAPRALRAVRRAGSVIAILYNVCAMLS